MYKNIHDMRLLAHKNAYNEKIAQKSNLNIDILLMNPYYLRQEGWIMLLQFNVSNFLSIKDEVVLTAFANASKDHEENLIVYGKDRKIGRAHV